MKPTKQQFIKQVEEITGYKHWRSHYYTHWFRIKDKWLNYKWLVINKNEIEIYSEANYDYGYKTHKSYPIPNEWLTPLGEAIKEHYKTK